MKKNLVGLTLLASTLGWIATASPIMADEWGRPADGRGQKVERRDRNKDKDRDSDRGNGYGYGYGRVDRNNKPRYTPAPTRYTPAPTRYTPAPTRYTPARTRYTPARTYRRDDRDARHRSSVLRIRSRWGASLIQTPAVRNELTIHAERMARLDRMKVLAEQGRNRGLVVRITVLLERENARHEARMAALQRVYYTRR